MKKTLVNRLIAATLTLLTAVSFMSCGMGKDPTGENVDRIVYKAPEIKKGDIITIKESDKNASYDQIFIFAEEDEGTWIQNTKPGSNVKWPQGDFFDSMEFTYNPNKGTIFVNDVPLVQMLSKNNSEADIRIFTGFNPYYAENYAKKDNPGLYQTYKAIDGTSFTFIDSKNVEYKYASGDTLKTKYTNTAGKITFKDKYFSNVDFYFYDTGIILPTSSTFGPYGKNVTISSDKTLNLTLSGRFRESSTVDAVNGIALLFEEGAVPSIIKTIAITDKLTGDTSDEYKYYTVLKNHPEFDYKLTLQKDAGKDFGTAFNDITTLVAFKTSNSFKLTEGIFTGCSGLKEVSCTNVTSIGKETFKDTALEEIELKPNSSKKWYKDTTSDILDITTDKKKNAQIVLDVTNTQQLGMNLK